MLIRAGFDGFVGDTRESVRCKKWEKKRGGRTQVFIGAWAGGSDLAAAHEARQEGGDRQLSKQGKSAAKTRPELRLQNHHFFGGRFCVENGPSRTAPWTV